MVSNLAAFVQTDESVNNLRIWQEMERRLRREGVSYKQNPARALEVVGQIRSEEKLDNVFMMKRR